MLITDLTTLSLKLNHTCKVYFKLIQSSALNDLSHLPVCRETLSVVKFLYKGNSYEGNSRCFLDKSAYLRVTNLFSLWSYFHFHIRLTSSAISPSIKLHLYWHLETAVYESICCWNHVGSVELWTVFDLKKLGWVDDQFWQGRHRRHLWKASLKLGSKCGEGPRCAESPGKTPTAPQKEQQGGSPRSGGSA